MQIGLARSGWLRGRERRGREAADACISMGVSRPPLARARALRQGKITKPMAMR